MAALHVPRYHALDAIRAAMMLLGLVLHSGASYMATPLPVWPYHDPETSVFFDLVVYLIHLFRMPVFFIAAGFFAALLWERDGRRGFVTNRLRRVALPLAIAWPMAYPATVACTLFAQGQLTGTTQWSYLTSGQFLDEAQLMHFWFLYYLLIYYAVMALALPLVARIPAHVKDGVLDAFARVATRWWGLLVLAIATATTLVPMTQVAMDTGVTFLPPARVVVAYAVFFTFGLMLFARRDVLASFGRGWALSLALGLCVSVLYLMLLVADPTGGTWPRRLMMCVVAGLSVWLLIAGTLGVFLTHLDVERPVVRYLSDAAYWMYLVHLPVTLLVPGLLATTGLPALAKFVIVLSATAIVSLASYHFLVRSTVIGQLLNGRRYPVRLPLRETARA